MPKVDHYKIPSDWQAREALREKGQFWTPDWIAAAMVEYVLADGSTHLFDPAVGAGAFFRAAKSSAQEKKIEVALSGLDIDKGALAQSFQFGLSAKDLASVRVGDFIFNPPRNKLKAIVANPPYIRHHRLSAETKEKLRKLGAEITGQSLDGRAGLHIYFLIRALQLLDDNGRLAFIMPADTCEGIFANALWKWITQNYCLEIVITFDPPASPFPQVDTNPIVFMLRNAKPQAQFQWLRCHEAGTTQLRDWLASGYALETTDAFTVTRRELDEGVATGLSRSPVEDQSAGPVLGDFAGVLRGVATGANEFFFLTDNQVSELGLSSDFLAPAIGRTRDVTEREITEETIVALKAQGRPTWLLALDGKPLDAYPDAVRRYLKHGEALGLPKKPLISQRRPWYKMESRTAPPFLFTYLGRRNSRFIRNQARVIPLTCFLCVYPLQNDERFVERLWEVLSHPDTVANLPLIGKSYGAGAVKVEPRALERLPLPAALVEKLGLPHAQHLF
jgi:adenine-specific DNA-methyltransferase